MSSNLDNSATLAGAPPFRALVKAAIREHAANDLIDRTSGNVQDMWRRHDLSQAVVHDAESYVDKFAGLVADDAQVSATADPVAVDRARVRAVVAQLWIYVAASTPGLA